MALEQYLFSYVRRSNRYCCWCYYHGTGNDCSRCLDEGWWIAPWQQRSMGGTSLVKNFDPVDAVFAACVAQTQSGGTRVDVVLTEDGSASYETWNTATSLVLIRQRISPNRLLLGLSLFAQARM